MINRVKNLETRAGNLPDLPSKSLSVQVVGGMEALGRSHELARLDQFVGNIVQTLGQPAVDKYINVLNYLTRRATALALETKDLLRTQDEVDQATAEAQQTEVGKTIGPELVKQMGQQGAQAPQGPPPPQ
jgi:hypothetical protein